jgi:hypothetical protein
VLRFKPQPVCMQARLSFAVAFGISVEDQYLLESGLRKWSFSLEGDRVFGCGWSPVPWHEARDAHPEFSPLWG